MSLFRKENIRNGELIMLHRIYKCDKCGEEMPEEWGYHFGEIENTHYCHECAFKLGMMSGKEYGNRFGYLDYNYAGINPLTDKIEFVKAVFYKRGDKKGQLKSRRKFTWEMLPSELRGCRYYIYMRNSVLERDNYTCQDCGAKKGEAILNIHHIKPFSTFPEYRLDENNCVTLCSKCHKLRHKEGNLDGKMD